MQLSQRPSPSITSPAGTRSAGIDIAFIFDGTAYHTARDEVSRIRPGTLQDMGLNVLAALLEFGRVLASNPPDPAAAGAGGGSVYFDLWGRCMVSMQEGWALQWGVCGVCVGGGERGADGQARGLGTCGHG
jgi:hypothetical protein